MKITASILSIPPYISTSWENVSSLHVREEKGLFTLLVILQNGPQTEVPGLNHGQITSIFETHARFIEQKNISLNEPFSFSLPLKTEGGSIETLGNAMQHNPEQANLPDLPPEILKKITTIVKVFIMDNTLSLPKAEPHCNCVYCQVTRSLHGEAKTELQEEVTLEDLSFRNWEIEEIGKNLYLVTHPLDKNEHYTVFLGTPLGCTCGSKKCEHIQAVLNS